MITWNVQMIILRVWLYLERCRRALGEHWKRIIVGMLAGWLIGTFVGVFLDYFLYWSVFDLSLYVRNCLAFLTVYGSISIGGVIGYATRRERWTEELQES